MKRVLSSSMLSWIVVFHLSAGLFAADPADLEFFEKQIRPVLVKHCYECHSQDAKNVRGGLLLDTRAGLLRGGDSGPAVVPGKPEEGELLGALRYDAFEMPPRGKLPAATIAAFEKWIKNGAVDPREGEPAARPSSGVDLAEAKKRWAFQLPQRRPAPTVQQTDWPKTDTDHFILARLEAEQMTPAADAEPAVLLRRLYYDLIGLPPTPEELAAFVADPSPAAYSATVERLLASRHFGERWGRHWLDVARYADSIGAARTRTLEDAWRYRDYVINAFHQDKPFDQLIVEQLGGDLLPDDLGGSRAEKLIATGFLVLGPTNYELQDKERLRMDVVDEQIDTLSRAFLGLTTGCARCHDHKFDPIPTRDYYALAGVFRSTKTLTPGNVSGFVTQELPMAPDAAVAWEQHRSALKKQENELAEAKRELKKRQTAAAGGNAGQIAASGLRGIIIDETNAVFKGSWTASSGAFPFVGEEYRYASRGARSAHYQAALKKAGKYEVRLSHSPHANRATNVKVIVRHADGETVVRVNQTQPGPIKGLFVSLGIFEFAPGADHGVLLDCIDANGAVIADAVQFISLTEETPRLPADDAPSDNPEKELAAALAAQQSEVARLEAAITAAKKSAPPAPEKAMAVRDEDTTGDYFVCIRGDVHNLGEKVERGVLRALTSGDSSPIISSGASGRLEVAQWIASADNPLTSRVIVNRVWRHLFGEGIVRTPDNFGAMGEAPSHPDLLDALAVDFTAKHRWSIKSLIRELVHSRTYQLASETSPELRRADPENRWRGRATRRRMDAEAIRDYLLVASGQLDLDAGGPSFRPGVSEFGYQFNSLRRSVYVPVFRNTLHELFEVFDFADPNLVTGDRNTSIVPTQALYMLNSPFVMQQAKAAGEQILSISKSDAERLDWFYRLALGRAPTKEEAALSLRYLDEASDGPTARADAWSGICHAVFASLDFRYIR